MRRIRALVLPAVLLAGPAAAAEVPVAPGAKPDLIVYGDDFALVRERRTMKLAGPQTQLAFVGVSRALQPETAVISVLPTEQVKLGDVKILDQTFAFATITPEALMERSIGKEVSVLTTNPNTGRDIGQRAKLIAIANGQPILDVGGQIQTGNAARLAFDGLPPGLRPEPTLLMTAAGPAGPDIPIELSYLTGGLGWRADYTAAYDGDAGRVDLTAWATITNTTGVTFPEATLKLAAGDVNRVRPPQPPMPMRAAKMEMAAAAPMADGVAATSTAGQNIYSIARPTTLATGETKQVMMLSAVNLPVKREYVVRGEPWFYTAPMQGAPQEGRAAIEVTVKNEGARPKPPVKGKPAAPAPPAEGGLGVPLPPGIVRAYGQTADGAPQFLGEDRIDHVAPGGDIRLRLGGDVDLPVTRQQVSFVRASETIALSVWRLTLRNAKPRPVTVRVSEPVSGAWEISKSSISHVRSDAGTPEWVLNLPAKGEVVLEYTIRTTF
jgi:hypothetical protein